MQSFPSSDKSNFVSCAPSQERATAAQKQVVLVYIHALYL